MQCPSGADLFWSFGPAMVCAQHKVIFNLLLPGIAPAKMTTALLTHSTAFVQVGEAEISLEPFAMDIAKIA